MKRTLILTAALMCAVGAFAQGLINFNTKAGTLTTATPGGVWAPVFLPEPGDPVRELHGNPPNLGTLFSGTTTYSGGFVIGAGFTAQLWGGPAGSSENQLQIVATTTFRTQTATTVAGTVSPPINSPVVNGVPVGSMATFQLRAWDNKGGTLTSWAQVIDRANDSVMRGQSLLFTPPFALGDGALVPVPNLQGLQSFNLHIVPEPSVIALGILGVGALVLFRRRKN